MNAAHCWKRSGRRKGYRMYRGMLINKLNVYWGLSEGSCQSLWGTHIPYCSKDTLQKQCWSSACWSAALAATEGKREKIKSLPWIWCVAHNSTFNIHSVQLCLRLSSTLEALKGSFFLSRLVSCDLFLSFNDIWPSSMSPRTESKQSHLCSFPVCRKAALVQFYLWSYLTVTHLEQPTCWNTKTLMANEHK